MHRHKMDISAVRPLTFVLMTYLLINVAIATSTKPETTPAPPGMGGTMEQFIRNEVSRQTRQINTKVTDAMKNSNNIQVMLTSKVDKLQKNLASLDRRYINMYKKTQVALECIPCNQVPPTVPAPCHPNPCQHEGVCQQVGGIYTCHCKPGYTGINCEYAPCHRNPCQHEGVCQQVGRIYTCDCKPGYTGINCEYAPCDSNPCQHGGACTQAEGNPGAYRCICGKGFSGAHCESRPCPNNPCQNGGRCTHDGGKYTCKCVTGYTGSNCQILCNGRADICFVVDGSSSIRLSNVEGEKDNWELLLEFIVNLVTQIPIGPRDSHVAVVTFSKDATVEFNLEKYMNKDQMIPAIRRIKYPDGWTNTAAGIYLMMKDVFDQSHTNRNGDREDAINIGVVIIDGVSNINKSSTIPFANDAKKNGTHMLSVGISHSVNEVELKGISSSGIRGDTYWTSPNFEVTSEIIDNIINEACTAAGNPRGACESNPCHNGGQCTDDTLGNYKCLCSSGFSGTKCQIGPCDNNPCQNRGICTADGGKYTCACVAWFTGSNCQISCEGNPDICFVVDGSSSIRPSNVEGDKENWEHLLDFLVKLVTQIPIGQNDIHVALVSVSDIAKVEFNLEKYVDKGQMIQAIRQIPYQGGGANVSAGIHLMRTAVFDPANSNRKGDREDAINIGVTITNGASNSDKITTRNANGANVANDDGIVMLAVGITFSVSEVNEGISSSRILGDTYWTSPNFEVRPDMIDGIIKEVCTAAGTSAP